MRICAKISHKNLTEFVAPRGARPQFQSGTHRAPVPMRLLLIAAAGLLFGLMVEAVAGSFGISLTEGIMGLSSRELAMASWSTVAVGGVLAHPATWAPIGRLLATLLKPFILAVLGLFGAYILGVLWVLDALGLWTSDLVKVTALWFVVAVPFVFSMFMKDASEGAHRRLAAHHLRALIVLEYFVASYTFAFKTELVLVGGMTALALLIVVGEVVSKDPATKQAHAFLVNVQVLVGLAILGLVVAGVVRDFGVFASLASVREVVLPALLSLASVPFAYGVLLVSKYDQLFVKLRLGPKKAPRLSRYAKRQLTLYLRLNARRVEAFTKAYGFEVNQLRDPADVDALVVRARAGQRPPEEA